MSFRHVELCVSVLVGSAYGVYTRSFPLVGGGALLGAMAWMSWDSWRLRQVLRWLQSEDWGNEPRLPHAWGTLVDRVRKLQKNLSGKARDSQARLDEFLSAIQASPNGVLLLDSQGRIEWCNQTAADHLGIDPHRDLMQHVTNLVREPQFSAYLGAREFHTEVAITSPLSTASKPVVVAIRIHPYGKKRRLMLSRDVTAVQQAEAMRRDFVANVSHEIRTPLTVLSGFVETLQTLDLNEGERSHYLALMATQAERMQTLVSDLLMLSKLEGSPVPSRQAVVRASVLLARCMEEAQSLSTLMAGPTHVFSADTAADFDLAGNETELASALSNLLNNAVRYTPGGGRISVGLRRVEGNDAEIWVSDTGPGIAPEHMPRLTERFYRVDRSRSRDTGGTGLGLAIVKHVAQRHGGHIRIDSKLGEGSVFTLRFPSDRVVPVSV
jgi:two-component system phosphate regulon sensor histidine kinase PhoR